MRIHALLPLILLSILWKSEAAPPPKGPELVVVLVIDGLRPDSIKPDVTPNLHGLKSRGVWYTNAHSVFPTVTRVNTTSITTGALPSRHGIVSNALYLPTVSNTVLSNGEYRNLLRLGELKGGRIVDVKSLGEYLEAANIRYVALSSGSTGNGVLLNPTAPYGRGSLINPGFEKGTRVAYPDSLNSDLIQRFGTIKDDDGDAPLLWTERVLREYVLETLKPQVIINWMGRTDSAQHQHGVGSPEALSALRLVDRQIGLLLDQIRQKNLEDKTDIIVTCDHGFDHEPATDALAPLRDAHFPEGDVVVDNEGGTSLFYVKNHDPEKILKLVGNFQVSATTNAIFVPSRRPENGALRCSAGAEKGFAPGTFALEFAGLCHTAFGPDMVVTYRWDSTANPFGVPGTQWIPSAVAGKQQSARNGHGGLNPYVTHSTLIAAGSSFKQGATITLPAGNQDITPTLLAIQGLTVPAELDGRVLSESLKNPSAAGPQKPAKRSIRVSNGNYCAELDASYAGKRVYLNHAQRCAGNR